MFVLSFYKADQSFRACDGQMADSHLTKVAVSVVCFKTSHLADKPMLAAPIAGIFKRWYVYLNE